MSYLFRRFFLPHCWTPRFWRWGRQKPFRRTNMRKAAGNYLISKSLCRLFREVIDDRARSVEHRWLQTLLPAMSWNTDDYSDNTSLFKYLLQNAEESEKRGTRTGHLCELVSLRQQERYRVASFLSKSAISPLSSLRSVDVRLLVHVNKLYCEQGISKNDSFCILWSSLQRPAIVREWEFGSQCIFYRWYEEHG